MKTSHETIPSPGWPRLGRSELISILLHSCVGPYHTLDSTQVRNVSQILFRRDFLLGRSNTPILSAQEGGRRNADCASSMTYIIEWHLGDFVLTDGWFLSTMKAGVALIVGQKLNTHDKLSSHGHYNIYGNEYKEFFHQLFYRKLHWRLAQIQTCRPIYCN